jgi:ornithine decarboxylase
VCKFNKKFGCSIDQVREILVIAKTLKLNVMGFSFHVGSNCSSADTYFDALMTVREAVDIAKSLDITTTMVDIGGGFKGVDGDTKFVDITTKIKEGIEAFFPDYEEKGLQFIAEPGRYFAQRTHTLVMNVIGKKIFMDKEKDEKTIVYYLNDGIYGSFNCIMFDHERPTILPFNERNEKQFRSRLFGPTCDSIDMISDEVMLPELATGEWVYSENMGAYTVAATSNFNGFRTNLFRYILRS